MKIARSDRLDTGVIARYRSYLPITESTPVISLNEGSTPLVHSPKLSAMANADVFLKCEGINPTGSFKDRGMTVALSLAVERGAETVICASTGNTSAAAAAYAARAGIQCAVLLPAGKIAKGKLVQAYAYGARVIPIEGNFDDALRLVREAGTQPGIAIVNSINPDRIEGQKTAAFEIIEALGDAPAIHILPVGNAGNITAYWKGYHEFGTLGKTTRLPRMIGFQAAGAAPIFRGAPVAAPETKASAIRIGNPASWAGATAAIEQSRGAIDIIEDQAILNAQSWLAANEGIFVEPASAISVAGLMKCLGRERCANCPFQTGSENPIVLTVTGHGLKDPDTVVEAMAEREPIPATLEAVLKALQ